MRQKRTEESTGIARRAVSTAGSLVARYPHDAAYTENLAQAYARLGQGLAVAAGASGPVPALQDVLSVYQKALAILESNGPRTEEPWLAQESAIGFYIAYAFRELGNRTGEITYYQQALESALKGDTINRRLVTAHPAQPYHRRNLADGLTEIAFLRWKCCRDLAGALRDIHDALNGFGGLAEQDPENMEARRDVANAKKNLGWILGEAGRLKEALGANREALAIYERVRRADPDSQEDAGYIAEVQARIAALAESK
jgi:tetratricopeptide (TPR) repeat protein